MQGSVPGPWGGAGLAQQESAGRQSTGGRGGEQKGGVREVIRDLKTGGPAGRCEHVAIDYERHGTHWRVLNKE